MSVNTRLFSRLFCVGAILAVLLLLSLMSSSPTHAQYTPGIPAAVDPGTPSFGGSSNPIPAEPLAYNPSNSMLQAIFNADVAAGGTSYWIDRILARPYLSADYQNFLFTRGRALYMYTYAPGTLGFGGGYAYRERPTGSDQNLFTISISGSGLSETTSQRVQYPSHASSLFTRSGLSVLQKKFITYNNVAVDMLTITNTGSSATSVTVTASSPIATSASGSELTGTVGLRYGLSTIYPRFSGDGFSVSGSSLTRTISLAAGQTVTLKVQLGALANEIPESTADYNRYRGYDANTAFLTHLREYNQWWVDNVPYIDLPNKNIEKMVYYRMFLNRFNYFDGNIPGSDYQFPVSIEGVTGYNNAIQLTQPMHMQDLKYFRNPVYAYGNWLSSGENSKYGPFTDNPGGSSWGVGNPNGTYEQYIGFEAFESYKVHGGQPALLNNLARYAEGDATGYLAKYDQNNNFMIAYSNGADTGNDADAVALAYTNHAPQERTESAFWFAGAKASGEAYALLGNTSKANAMTTLSNNIRNAVLNNLWDNAAASSGGKVFKQKDIASGSLVPWKDQQNWVPFSFGLVPNTADYREALRFYADRAQMPIMPSYTANQADKAAAVAAGKGGSNNFSNINSTLHAQLFSAALRNYPSSYVTADSYRKLIEWETWTEYINGDNRLPDNNEFWADYNPSTGSLYRSWIHHNILGAYNFMIIEDVMGVRPRADNIVELWPIDMGYDHFTVNNLRYHGQDMTLVWDKPGGTVYYGSTPEGYSLYLGGQRKFTVSDLTHLTWNSSTGQVTILGTAATVNYNTTGSLPAAINVSLSGNARMVDVVQKAGVDLSAETGNLANLAVGKTATASYSASNMNPAYAVDGFTVSGIPVTVGSWVGRNPIWGTQGSPNNQDWLQVDLGATATFDTVKLYFHNNKAWPIGGNTYRQPSSYTVQYNNGSSWVDVPSQAKTPSMPWPNYNKVTFPAVSARLVRVLMTRSGTYGIGVKEIQIFNSGGVIITPTPTTPPPTTPPPTTPPPTTPPPTTPPPSANPVVWYRFDETGGTSAADASGNGLTATLNGGATWASGQIGNAVNLSGSSQYVSMPAGVVSGLNDFTIATWVRLDTVSNWSRVFDFGTGTSVYMFLTPQSGSGVRFAITTGGSGGEQRINGTSALPSGSWVHVAVTLSGNSGTLYVNGAPVGQNTAMTLRPSSLGSTGNNYIGRSQYADPYLDGLVDDFRIYNRGLSAAETQALATSGPTPTPTTPPPTTPPPTTPPPTTPPPTTPPPPTNPVAWYRFDETGGTTAADASGNGRNATVTGGTWVAGRVGNAIDLSGSSQYVTLPAGIMSGLNDFTIATWVRLDTTGSWRRIFDFGSSTTVNMFLVPTSGSTIRFAITTSGSGGEQRINGTSALPTGTWKHVAVTLSGNTGTLYVDGVQVGQNTAMTLRPSSLGSTSNNWLGRSQYSGDAYLDGQIDDFRIYGRGLSASDVLALFQTP